MTAKAAPKTSHQVVAEDVSDEEEKDIEGGGKDEKPPIPMHPATPVPPPLPLPVAVPHLSRNNTDPGVVFLDSKTPTETGPSTVVASARIAELPRAATPPRKVSLLHPKTLVLDLDETLIHSTSRPMENGASGSGILSSMGFGKRNKVGHTVEVVLGGRSTLYHVYKRPFVDYFLRKVCATHIRPLTSILMILHVITYLRHARYPHGTRSLYLRHLCKSMPTQLLTGWTQAGVS